MTKKKTETRSGPPPIRLFVYGTLKRGYWNFERYCRNAVDIQPATVWGRLYQLSAGYPAIEVPETSILAYGTNDPVADAISQERLAQVSVDSSRPVGDWDLVHGEVMTFLNPERDLPPIDRLEGFGSNRHICYERNLIVCTIFLTVSPAWIFSMKKTNNERRILSGCWDCRIEGY